MATCRNCGINSRHESVPITFTELWVPLPPGTYSVAGTTEKLVMKHWVQLKCLCGYSILGHIDEEAGCFYGDPATEIFPEA